MGVEGIYEGWARIQARLVRRLPGLSTEELALSAASEGWPVWAIVAHLAGARVYWLCSVCGEPGQETTPFRDPANEGWEDTLDAPRTAAELLFAIESSWRIVTSCLERWTPEMLDVAFERVRAGKVERHTRSSVLTRLLSHDAFHTGEASMLLGGHGAGSMDPWEPI